MIRRGVGINKGVVCEHGANGRFIAGINHGGSCNRVGHGKGVERHVLLTDSAVDIRMKEEEVRCELVDLCISDVGGGRMRASNMVMVALDERSLFAGGSLGSRCPVSAVGDRCMVQLTYVVEGSYREMKELMGVEAVLSCPPVERLDRAFKVKVGQFVLLEDGWAKGGDLFHSGDAGV